MVTLRQIEASAAALCTTWSQIVEMCAEDACEYDVLTTADRERLPRPNTYQVGDVVAIRSRGRYRAARVWKVNRRTRRISALYLVHGRFSNTYAPTLRSITRAPLGLIARA